jgi:hypothetical protein
MFVPGTRVYDRVTAETYGTRYYGTVVAVQQPSRFAPMVESVTVEWDCDGWTDYRPTDDVFTDVLGIVA